VIKTNLDQSHTKKKEEWLIIRKADKNMKALEKEEKGTEEIHLQAESHTKKENLRGKDIQADLLVLLKLETITNVQERFLLLFNHKILLKNKEI
jgi:hypothetical protein